MKGQQILFISKSVDDAATRYRANILKPELERRGCSIVHVDCEQPWYRLRILLTTLHSDIVFIQRKLLGSLFFIALRSVAKNLVFDFDDAIFLKSNGKPSSTRSTRFANTANACALILAGNEYLADEAKRFCSNVQVVPTGISLASYPINTQSASDGPELVWIGSSSTRKYLEQQREVFVALHAAFPDLRLRIIADFEWPECPLRCETIAWSADTEVASLQGARIGIAPMPDNPWTRGKCALKVVQYMAAGLPVVSSRAGANSEVIKEHETGLLAETPQQWVSAIRALLEDPQRAAAMGQAGRRRAEKYYAQEALVPHVCDLLEQLVV